jgi:hypothetical protein
MKCIDNTLREVKIKERLTPYEKNIPAKQNQTGKTAWIFEPHVYQSGKKNY